MLYDSKLGITVDDKDNVASADKVYKEIFVGAFPLLSYHLVWATLAGTLDAVFTLEMSNNGTSWVPIPGKTFTITTADGEDLSLDFTDFNKGYVRGVYTSNNVSGGTLSVYAITKGR